MTTGGVDELSEFSVDMPDVGLRDVLIKVHAVSVNPVDTKRRANWGKTPHVALKTPLVLGSDAAGTVVAVGSDVTRVSVGQRVYTHGDMTRPGSNAAFLAVDERRVGVVPSTLTLTQAACVPLAGLTAWECLVEELCNAEGGGSLAGRTILVLPGAGGVGSFALQLAKNVLRAKTVVATASRYLSDVACRERGADVVINHKLPLRPQLEAAGVVASDGECGVDCILCGYDPVPYFEQLVDIVRPFGRIVNIVEPSAPLDVGGLMFKRVALAGEFVFARTVARQGDALTKLGSMLDLGLLSLPHLHVLPFTLENLRLAHVMQESGRVVGKIVLTHDDAV